ncbi:MAG: hypothetical protein ACRDRX_13890 [Pseudonocardiaceae bacterium]
MSLSDDAVVLLAWITLSRVAEGTVAKQGESYLDGGAPLPPYLVVSVSTLLTEGLLAVADADPAGWCPVILTESGRTRREQLRRRGAGGVDIP